jgi:hypothetical protein
MTQLGGDISQEVKDLREEVYHEANSHQFRMIDADSETTGQDFLQKIWRMIVSVPVGIAIVHQDMPSRTLLNIFYEIGLMQAYGKRTVIVKTANAEVPSDFVRTEYIEQGSHFRRRLRQFFESLLGYADYCGQVAEQLENNPVLSIDYYRRAYLLTADDYWRDQARDVFDSAGLKDRAKNSVEAQLASFCR